jgi:hypothetical protein
MVGCDEGCNEGGNEVIIEGTCLGVSNGFPLLHFLLDVDKFGGSVFILLSFIMGCDDG